MRILPMLRSLAALTCLATALVARASLAQDAGGLSFDVMMTTGDSAAGTHQTGRGWISGKRTRLDLRGAPNAAQAIPPMPGMTGQNVSMIIHDSGGTPVMALVDHDTRQFIYPSRMMEQLKEMMGSLGGPPKMAFSVTNVVLDTLGAGETISGFATKRFRLSANISISVDMMGESMSQTMHIETDGHYAEELSEFADPLRDTRGFKSMTSGMPWMDSSATAELEKLMLATPRGLALRQVDRVTGASVAGESSQTTTTQLSNIKREAVSPAVFAMPEGYTELEMPQIPAVN